MIIIINLYLESEVLDNDISNTSTMAATSLYYPTVKQGIQLLLM